jgi:molybdopterin adenylyltransferase
VRIAVLTISDTRTMGDDASGDAIANWARERGHAVAERAIVADETGAIAATMMSWADGDRADLILTTGGTGLTVRDVTPEATRAVIDKEVTGIAEAMRMTAYPRFHKAALSRATAGVRGRTLIVNMPGSPGGVKDGLAVLDDIVVHAVDLVRGVKSGH